MTIVGLCFQMSLAFFPSSLGRPVGAMLKPEVLSSFTHYNSNSNIFTSLFAVLPCNRMEVCKVSSLDGFHCLLCTMMHVCTQLYWECVTLADVLRYSVEFPGGRELNKSFACPQCVQTPLKFWTSRMGGHGL